MGNTTISALMHRVIRNRFKNEITKNDVVIYNSAESHD